MMKAPAVVLVIMMTRKKCWEMEDVELWWLPYWVRLVSPPLQALVVVVVVFLVMELLVLSVLVVNVQCILHFKRFGSGDLGLEMMVQQL
jgi:hypothetical protein